MLKTWCLVLLVFTANPIGAQDQADAPAASVPEQGQGADPEKSVVETEAEEKKLEAETPDAFKPTEQIDEDYSIAFPVDI